MARAFARLILTMGPTLLERSTSRINIWFFQGLYLIYFFTSDRHVFTSYSGGTFRMTECRSIHVRVHIYAGLPIYAHLCIHVASGSYLYIVHTYIVSKYELHLSTCCILDRCDT